MINLKTLVVLAVVTIPSPSIAAFGDDFESVVNALNTRSFDDKLEAASRLATMDHERVDVVLQALIDGKLYKKKGDDTVVSMARKPKSRLFELQATQGFSVAEIEASLG